MVDRVLKEVDHTWVIVLQLLDNSLYFVEGESGEFYLPRKDPGGSKYHVDGALHLASSSQVLKAVRKLLPLLHVLKKNKKLIFAPQARYLFTPCCGDSSHCTNMSEEDYRRRMLERISVIRREVKDICYDERITKYRVANPCGMLGYYDFNRSEEASANRGQDPVHLAPAGYDKLAQGIIQQVEMEGAAFNGGKRELEDEDEVSQAMRESLPKRRDWIYNTGVAGSWRGGHRGRRGGQGTSRGGAGPSRGHGGYMGNR